MPLLAFQTKSAVKKIGSSEYQAITDDPHFIYRFWPRGPRYLVLFIDSLDKSLDPKLYIDRGNGFDEDSALLLRHAGPSLYTIRISPPYRVRRIRIDPCSNQERFRFWMKCAHSEAKLADIINKAEHASAYDVTIDGSHEKRTKKERRVKHVGDHFASVVQLAERTAPPIPPEFVKEAPFISFVVPVYNTPPAFLDDLLASFQKQPAGAAELILSDDRSTLASTRSWLSSHEQCSNVRLVRSAENRGIALACNAGLSVARGQWVGFLDHDDALTPGAVQLIFQTAQDHPDCQLIYTDEVVTDEKLKPKLYFFKPAYDEVLLSGVNYINHLSCYRRERLLSLGGLRAGYEGSQDYDLLLRYVRDLPADQIKHLPYPAYRWRRSSNAFSAQHMDRSTKSARQALAEHYGRGGAAPPIDAAIAKTLHRVRFDSVKTQWPRVSIIIPNRDLFSLISRILSDLTKRTGYPDLEIIVIDNGTTDRQVLDLYANMQRGVIPFFYEINPGPFNFSAQVNRGIELASGDLILLLNNDIEVIERDWLREMVACFDYPGTGIVGARLLYPNHRLQHAGVIIGLGGLAGHWFIGKRESYPGPMARLHVRQSLTAVTGACMLISRSCLEDVGRLDEQEFAVAYNDIDFCLRAVKRGYRVVWTPFATLIHHELATRGSDDTGPNRVRFFRDKAKLLQRHATDKCEDRAFSPWYTRDRAEPAALLLDELPKAR